MFQMCSGRTTDGGKPFLEGRKVRTIESAHGHKFGAFAVTLSPARDVAVRIYDLRGRRLRTLVTSPAQPGSLTLVWDGHDSAGDVAPTGTYLAVMTAGHDVRTAVRFVWLR